MTRIHAKVDGFIEQMLVDIGDRVTGPKKDEQGKIVEPGQLLAVLVAPELTDELLQKQAIVEQAQSQIEQAEAAVQVAEAAALSAQANVSEAVASQKKSEAEYTRWKLESERIQELVSSRTVTNKLGDETRQLLAAADATREESRAKVRSAEARFHEATVSITKAKADLSSAQARLRIAEAELQRIKSLSDYLQIRAPYSGTISERGFDPGSLVVANQASDANPLFTIVQTDRVRVILNVPEAEAPLVKQGGKASIRLPALNNRIFEGTVARTSWALRTNTRTLECEIDAQNAEELLRPGMYANVELTLAAKNDVLVLPRSAVLMSDGKPTCLVVGSDGTLARKSITTGIMNATDIEIVTGLDGTEDVISANGAAYKEGQKVNKDTANRSR